jgi:hypothetical protein
MMVVDLASLRPNLRIRAFGGSVIWCFPEVLPVEPLSNSCVAIGEECRWNISQGQSSVADKGVISSWVTGYLYLLLNTTVRNQSIGVNSHRSELPSECTPSTGWNHRRQLLR